MMSQTSLPNFSCDFERIINSVLSLVIIVYLHTLALAEIIVSEQFKKQSLVREYLTKMRRKTVYLFLQLLLVKFFKQMSIPDMNNKYE